MSSSNAILCPSNIPREDRNIIKDFHKDRAKRVEGS
jgi:hypothetical protein